MNQFEIPDAKTDTTMLCKSSPSKSHVKPSVFFAHLMKIFDLFLYTLLIIVSLSLILLEHNQQCSSCLESSLDITTLLL